MNTMQAQADDQHLPYSWKNDMEEYPSFPSICYFNLIFYIDGQKKFLKLRRLKCYLF